MTMLAPEASIRLNTRLGEVWACPCRDNGAKSAEIHAA
jgi:hypothetical protein